MGKYRNEALKSVNTNTGKDYDFVLERSILKFKLNKRNRIQHLKDKVHFLLMFWVRNNTKFKKYKTLEKIGVALNLHHSTVIFYVKKRKKSLEFEKNIVEINEFIIMCCSKKMKIENDFIKTEKK
jgi:hypothetical protein